MKLAVFLTLTTVLQATAGGFAQTITLTAKNEPLQRVMEEIKKQSGFHFFLTGKQLADIKVNTTIRGASLKKAMDALTRNLGVEWVINDQVIILRAAEIHPTLTGLVNDLAVQQIRVVTGRVTDEGGTPLEGVTVAVKRTPRAAITGADGRYRLVIPDVGKTLTFSMVGFEPTEKSVGSQEVVNAILQASVSDLDEVVVVGYGTLSKALMVSSATSVAGDKLVNLPVSNINQAIATIVPSISVNGTASERPGSAPALRIRGESSINGGEPLVLVDGIPSTMNTIDPNDVESLTVLKDAASTAIYGARGATGVILITTKSGSKNQTVRLGYNALMSQKSPTLLPKMIDSKTYVEGRANAESAAGISTLWNHPDILAALDDPNTKNIPDPRRPSTHFVGTDNVDWINEVIGHSTIQQHNVSVDGGGENGSYRISTGYLGESAIYNYGDFGYKRYNVRANIGSSVLDMIDLKANISFVRSKNDQPVRGWDQEMNQTYFSHPNDPIKWNTGIWGANNDGNVIQDLVEGGHNVMIDNELLLNFSADLEITKSLTFTGLAGFQMDYANQSEDQRSILRYSVRPDVVIGNLYVPNQLIKSTTNSIYKNFQGYFTFDRTFGNHSLTLLAGGAFEDSFQDNLIARRQTYFSNDLIRSLDLGTGDQYASGAPTDWAIGSVFGRLNYDFRQKYILEASMRYDGSSRFTPEYRWGLFPSVAVGWRLSEEAFLDHLTWLNTLKLMASWGTVGNQSGIGLYDFISRLTVEGYYPMGSGYNQDRWVIQNSLASLSRTWETIETRNVGVDFGLWNEKLGGRIEYYTKLNRNMLVPVDVPSVIGLSVPTFNSGELKTTGWELIVNWNDHIGQFSYGVSATLHDSKNIITRFERSKDITAGTQNIEGYPLNSFFGYQTVGYFQSDEEVEDWAFQHSLNAAGDVKYLDLDGDNRIGIGDLAYLGNPTPRYNYMLNLHASWKKQFDLAITFEGIGKRNIPVPSVSRITYPVAWPRFIDHMDYWTPENPDAMFPRLYNGANWNWWNSDRLIWDGSYLRLRNIQIGYSLTGNWLGRIGVSKLRLYLNGRNLFSIDNYIPYLDPELTNVVQYPVMKSFSAGLNLIF